MGPERSFDERGEGGEAPDVTPPTSGFAAYRPSSTPTVANEQEHGGRGANMKNALRAARATTFAWDFHHDVLWWDDPHSPLFERASAEALARTLDSFLVCIYEADRPRLRAALRGAALEGRSTAVECRVQKRDNTFAWLEARARGTIAEDGSPLRLYGAFVDVSAQKALEAELRATQNRLQTALVAGNIGTQVWNMQTGEVDSDALSDRLFGSTAAEMISSGFDKFLDDVHPDDRVALAGHYAAAFSAPSTARWHYRYTRKDRSRVWVAAYTITEHDELGRPWRMTTAIADVTEPKRAEQRLTLQNSVSRVLESATSADAAVAAILGEICRCEGFGGGTFWSPIAGGASLQCGVVWLDPALSTDGVFEASLRTRTAARGEGVPGTVWQCLTPMYWSGGADAGSDAVRGATLHLEQPAGCAYAVRDQGEFFGVFTFFSRAMPDASVALDALMDAVSRNLVAFILRRRAEDTLRQLNLDLEERVRARTRELESANKELESFSYTVSHDLRAPLRTVDGFAQALVADFASQLPAEAQRLIATIRDGAQRMGQLIDDLLDFSRLGRALIRKRDVDTEAVVRECIDELQPLTVGRDVELAVSPLPACYADRSLLKQVWMNLLSNAIKYSSKRERARIEVGVVEHVLPIAYFVRDNGTGFDMRYAAKLFGVFRRLHRADEFEGTGVGLAITHRIVSRHGGRIWADAVRERGATFFFTLEEDLQW